MGLTSLSMACVGVSEAHQGVSFMGEPSMACVAPILSLAIEENVKWADLSVV